MKAPGDEDAGEGAEENRCQRREDADALDVIEEGIRSFLSKELTGAHADGLAESVATWLETLFTRLRKLPHRDQSQEEDADDVIEVLAMVLSTCVANQWRRVIAAQKDSIGDIAFNRGNMVMLLGVLVEGVSESQDDAIARQERLLTACEIIYALGSLAATESEVGVLLNALRARLDQASKWRDYLSELLSAIESLTQSQQLAVCFVRFLTSVAAHPTTAKATSSRTPRSTCLGNLIGHDVLDQWKTGSWESKWQVHDNPAWVMRTFGSSMDCEDMVLKILKGFSIPQTSADVTNSTFSAESFLLSLDADVFMGLRHQVDVTLVKNGQLHFKWKANDRVTFDDITDAFRNKYTIGIRGVHARSRVIAAVCDVLQQELLQHVNANIYWTPPGQQGFNLHVDDHCGKALSSCSLFVIQLKGKKNWHVSKHIGVLPMLYSDLPEPANDGAADRLTLNPGNILYIPRGTPHCADTKGLSEGSLHVTIGVEIEPQFTKQELLFTLLSQVRQSNANDERSNSDKKDEVTEILSNAVDAESCRNYMRGGLVAWHIETDEAFRAEIELLLSLLANTLDQYRNAKEEACRELIAKLSSAAELVQKTRDELKESNAKLYSLRRQVLADRNSFLRRRQQASGMLACLQESLHHGDTRRDSRVYNSDDECQVTKRVKR
ncbi:putative Nucleolar protein, partial [Globisporangium splendens]